MDTILARMPSSCFHMLVVLRKLLKASMLYTLTPGRASWMYPSRRHRLSGPENMPWSMTTGRGFCVATGVESVVTGLQKYTYNVLHNMYISASFTPHYLHELLSIKLRRTQLNEIYIADQLFLLGSWKLEPGHNYE